jgi:hypothetical protein
MRSRSAIDATLLDVLVDGFEKNEILYGYHVRQLPLPDEAAARQRFEALVREATAWKGPASDLRTEVDRQRASWDDLAILQAGRGVLVLVRAPWFSEWWHGRETWVGHPMEDAWDYFEESAAREADGAPTAPR